MRALVVHHDIDIPAIRSAKSPKLEKRLPGYLLQEQITRLFAHAETAFLRLIESQSEASA